MSNVTFSVVIVSLNAESTILDTLNSVFQQSCDDYEVIVKDGRSSDHTLDIIPYNKKIKVFVEDDRSVYDAMNQALKYVNGKYVIYMNCGDTFNCPDILEKVKAVITEKQLSGNEVLYGNYSKNGKDYTQAKLIDKKFMVKSGLCHQTVFFGRVLFERFGGFDTSLKICADYEIMARVFSAGISYIYIDETICNYLGGGISEKDENLSRVRQEGNIVRRRYFSVVDRFYYDMSRFLKRISIIRE